MKRKGIIRLAIVVLGILSIPLIAMQFTEEVNWNVTDFIVAGIILTVFFFVINYIITHLKNSKYKYGYLVLSVIFFILLWAELAVGIFNSPLSGS
ncbi:MAG: hypothetical protein BM564_03480 [Bacteroidetes bacterium MedPE-SWsnd-G2]|nr:MAG: hypothetical protein BM564_03480 [Bacteroidetes bacterium MedPE-SWsnd-G2]